MPGAVGLPRDARAGATQWLPLAALAFGLAALAAWRARCVLAGPDVDTDAYARTDAMIARAILADPHRPGGALGVAAALPLRPGAARRRSAARSTCWCAGRTSVLSAARPVVLYAYRAAHGPLGGASAARPPRRPRSSLRAHRGRACPIVMQMGTTAQPELLFALLPRARHGDRVPGPPLPGGRRRSSAPRCSCGTRRGPLLARRSAPSSSSSRWLAAPGAGLGAGAARVARMARRRECPSCSSS